MAGQHPLGLRHARFRCDASLLLTLEASPQFRCRFVVSGTFLASEVALREGSLEVDGRALQLAADAL